MLNVYAGIAFVHLFFFLFMASRWNADNKVRTIMYSFGVCLLAAILWPGFWAGFLFVYLPRNWKSENRESDPRT